MSHDSRQLVALWNRASDACEEARKLVAASDQQVRASKDLMAWSAELMGTSINVGSRRGSPVRKMRLLHNSEEFGAYDEIKLVVET